MSTVFNDDLGKLILRLSVGVLVLFHGVSKIFNPGSLDYIASTLNEAGLPGLLAYGVYVGEVLAPLLVILGLYARVGGAVICLNMLFAIGLVHMGELFMLTDNGGWALELQGMFLFTALAVACMGSGRLAVRPD